MFEDDMCPAITIGEIPAKIEGEFTGEEELTEERKEEIRRKVREYRKPGRGLAGEILAEMIVRTYLGRVEGLTL